jgi:hypothetical protein
VMISAVLISMMVSAGFGLSAVLPLSTTLFTASCFSFVDDTDLVHAAASVDSPASSLLPHIQTAVDLWADGVAATGGAIRPDKSFWCLIEHKWEATRGRWRLARIREAPGELSITGLDGSRETLRRIQSNQAGKTLRILHLKRHLCGY